MDRERFGRALGTGARAAGKALLQAADAAASPAPGAAAARPGTATAPGIRPPAPRPPNITAGVRQGGRNFGRALWNPLARASGVLWLEVTGVFFGLFALTAAIEVWRRHRDFATAGAARNHLLFAVGMLLVFGWFTCSSFLRARRRSRR